MLTRIVVMLTALAAPANLLAQSPRAPWPSEYFNQKDRTNIAGEFDYYTLVVSWSPTHCLTAERGRDDAQCRRSDGLRYGFLLHGLWPQYEKGYPERCRMRGRPFVPDPVIDRMLDVMPSKALIIHEYRTHGTCSGLHPAQYFALARRLFNRIQIPKRYHNPLEVQFVSPQELTADLLRENPDLKPDMIAITCGTTGNRLRDVRICMTKDGRPRSCGQNENQRVRCQARQMFVPAVRSRRMDKVAPPRALKEIQRPRVIESPGPL